MLDRLPHLRHSPLLLQPQMSRRYKATTGRGWYGRPRLPRSRLKLCSQPRSGPAVDLDKMLVDERTEKQARVIRERNHGRENRLAAIERPDDLRACRDQAAGDLCVVHDLQDDLVHERVSVQERRPADLGHAFSFGSFRVGSKRWMLARCCAGVEWRRSVTGADVRLCVRPER